MPDTEKTNSFGLTTKTSETTPALPAKKQLFELRKLLLDEKAEEVVKKVIEIALSDEHPVQSAALKMCMDRLLPVSEFEKAGGGTRPTVNINITGLTEPITIKGDEDNKAT